MCAYNPRHGRLRQEDLELEASLTCLRKQINRRTMRSLINVKRNYLSTDSFSDQEFRGSAVESLENSDVATHRKLKPYLQKAVIQNKRPFILVLFGILRRKGIK